MQVTSIADVRSIAREYLCWIDRDGALNEEQIDEVASQAADRWWDKYGVGWFAKEEISELYEYVDEEVIRVAEQLP
jgi:hypothetical protein